MNGKADDATENYIVPKLFKLKLRTYFSRVFLRPTEYSKISPADLVIVTHISFCLI